MAENKSECWESDADDGFLICTAPKLLPVNFEDCTPERYYSPTHMVLCQRAADSGKHLHADWGVYLLLHWASQSGFGCVRRGHVFVGVDHDDRDDLLAFYWNGAKA